MARPARGAVAQIPCSHSPATACCPAGGQQACGQAHDLHLLPSAAWLRLSSWTARADGVDCIAAAQQRGALPWLGALAAAVEGCCLPAAGAAAALPLPSLCCSFHHSLHCHLQEAEREARKKAKAAEKAAKEAAKAARVGLWVLHPPARAGLPSRVLPLLALRHLCNS